MFRPIYKHSFILGVSLIVLSVLAMDYALGKEPAPLYRMTAFCFVLYSFGNVLDECARLKKWDA